jgi:hypothetical protein
MRAIKEQKACFSDAFQALTNKQTKKKKKNTVSLFINMTQIIGVLNSINIIGSWVLL